MFSPNTRIYNNAKENGLSTARKPDFTSVSVKKPLGDISVNRTTEKKPLKAFQTKQSVFNKTEQADIKKIPKENYPDWLADVSSYKEVEDSYEDILPKKRNTKNTTLSILQYYTHPPSTPPPIEKPIEIYPMFLVVPRNDPFSEMNFRLDLSEINEDNVPIPDIFCDFAF